MYKKWSIPTNIRLHCLPTAMSSLSNDTPDQFQLSFINESMKPSLTDPVTLYVCFLSISMLLVIPWANLVIIYRVFKHCKRKTIIEYMTIIQSFNDASFYTFPFITLDFLSHKSAFVVFILCTYYQYIFSNILSIIWCAIILK